MFSKRSPKPSAPLSLEEILALELSDFNVSDRRWWMLTGEEYYTCGDTEISRRQMGRVENGRLVPDDSRPNNRLQHSYIKNMVDDKVAYLLSRDCTLRCENADYVRLVTETLGRDFTYQLTRLGLESSNKGIGWLQVYLDEQGRFGLQMIPAEQCVPLWQDDAHTRLDGLIRYYDRTLYEGHVRRTRTQVEYYTPQEVRHYVLEDGRLYEEVDAYENPVQPHYVKNGKAMGFGRVPFIAFRNNGYELPDLRFVKSLIDEYDKTRSDNANFLEELRKLYWVLKGYSGTDLAEFRRNLSWYGVIRIDDPADGGVETICPQVDLSGFTAHFDQLRRDIIECGQGVNKNVDSIGSNSSGVALKFLHSSLDLKCNHMEVEYQHSFRQLLYFVNRYLAECGEGDFDGVDMDIVFNRDITINETEAIENCVRSLEVLSRKSVLEQHPWVKDVGLELERLQMEQTAATASAVPEASGEQEAAGPDAQPEGGSAE